MNKWVKVGGLFLVVFTCAGINTALGVSETSVMVGTVIGAGIYLLSFD